MTLNSRPGSNWTVQAMAARQPRPIILSEIVQLVLLCDPVWRALEMDSSNALIGATVLCLAAVALIELAVRGRRKWAREVLAGLAVFAVLGYAFEFITSSWLLDARPSNLEMIWPCINLIAVGMLFTSEADEWFDASRLEEGACDG
jgi:presenilin-like A22 family membrane protease